jgi:hypothetical protein
MANDTRQKTEDGTQRTERWKAWMVKPKKRSLEGEKVRNLERLRDYVQMGYKFPMTNDR